MIDERIMGSGDFERKRAYLVDLAAPCRLLQRRKRFNQVVPMQSASKAISSEHSVKARSPEIQAIADLRGFPASTRPHYLADNKKYTYGVSIFAYRRSGKWYRERTWSSPMIQPRLRTGTRNLIQTGLMLG